MNMSNITSKECCGIDPSLVTEEFIKNHRNLQQSRTRILYIIAATLFGYEVINIEEQALLNTVRTTECQVPIPSTFPLRVFANVWTVYGVSFFLHQEQNTLRELVCNPSTTVTSTDLCIHKNEIINYQLVLLVLLRRAARLVNEASTTTATNTNTNTNTTNTSNNNNTNTNTSANNNNTISNY